MIPALVLIAVAAVSLVFVVGNLHTPAPIAIPGYGLEWAERRRRYWHEHGRYCRICHTHRRPLELHHCLGLGNGYPVGHEPDHALLGVCNRCHQRIHNKERRLARMGLSRNLSRLPAVTRRALWLGCWRRALRRKP